MEFVYPMEENLSNHMRIAQQNGWVVFNTEKVENQIKELYGNQFDEISGEYDLTNDYPDIFKWEIKSFLYKNIIDHQNTFNTLKSELNNEEQSFFSLHPKIQELKNILSDITNNDINSYFDDTFQKIMDSSIGEFSVTNSNSETEIAEEFIDKYISVKDGNILFIRNPIFFPIEDLPNHITMSFMLNHQIDTIYQCVMAKYAIEHLAEMNLDNLLPFKEVIDNADKSQDVNSLLTKSIIANLDKEMLSDIVLSCNSNDIQQLNQHVLPIMENFFENNEYLIDDIINDFESLTQKNSNTINFGKPKIS